MKPIVRLLPMLLAVALAASAAGKSTYDVLYTARFVPSEHVAHVEIRVTPRAGRLRGLDFDMPAAVYRDIGGDGQVERDGERVRWAPPRAGGVFRYAVLVDRPRANGTFDSRMTPDWVITRGDLLFPPARARATRGSRSRARLRVELPAGWDDVESQFTRVTGGDFVVANAERRFDRPVGWIAAGRLTATRETIAGTRVTLVAPEGVDLERVQTFAILRHALPELRGAFGMLPDKLLIVRAGDPMWRGGLSAPQSLWLHAARPLISENGTSPLLHELTHVVSDIRGDRADDWIAEGLAEYYSLEIARRANLISQSRFDKAIATAAKQGAHVRSLRGKQSARDRTRRATALFAALDAELRAAGKLTIDDLVRRLMRREKTTLGELRADAAELQGRASKTLAAVE